MVSYGRNRAVAEIYHRLRDSGLGKHTTHPLQSISLGKAAHVEHRAAAIQSHRMRRSIERISRTRLVVIRACRNIEVTFRTAAECLAQLQSHEQLVTHGHVTVNGKKVDIPSYLCSINDVISFKESSKSLKVVREAIEKKPLIPAFVESDPNKVEGKFLRLPERSELYADIDEAQVVEFYNRKL